MQAKEQISQDYFNSLTIIHAALLTGQVIFGLVAYSLILNGQFGNNRGDLYDIFQIVVPLFVIGSLLGSSFLTKSRLKTIKNGKGKLKEKLGDYRATLIMKFILLEGAALFVLVCYLLTASNFLLGLAGLIVVIFLVNRPTSKKIAHDLELNQTDRALIKETLKPFSLK